ncbi:MAG: hypothetical protein JWR84_4054 [Caulobacter sp.]|nr:hypothetical protein [Caulobacter sp.]
MTKFAPVLFAIAGLALAGTAGAATPPAKARTVPAVSAKETACQAEWKAQKTHKGTHRAFIKACIAKG